MTNQEKEIRELVDELNAATHFYDKGMPFYIDEEWDDMYFALEELEKETGIIYSDSPTQKINYQVVNKLEKVKHNHPMLSLAKTKEIDEVKSFIKDKQYIAMAKMDGLTCSLWYKNGELVRAETRGDGEVGEDITHNAKVIPSIPNRIAFKEELIVDGEIICTYKDFEPFSKEYKNPRNFASGSIRLLDSKECEKRNLTFIAWNVIPFKKINQYLSNDLLSLRLDFSSNSFKTVPLAIGPTNLKSLEDDIEFIKGECRRSGYPIDGIVFKYDNIDEYNAAGQTAHHPNGGLAYKFYDELYDTKLRKVEWTMGRTGILTPVAVFDTVNIDGAEVTRANLHNISVKDSLLGTAAYVGQPIKVFKSNMIIPQVHESTEQNNDDLDYTEMIPYTPLVCPICGEAVDIKQENESKVLYCSNPNCEGKLVNKLDHFCGKKGLDIKGLSKATLEKLIDWGWVSELRDIYDLYLYKDEWKKKNGFGEKSVNNILKAIDESRKDYELWRLLSGLGIPLIGPSYAKKIAEKEKDYWSFAHHAADTNYDFSELDGFGEEMNKAIHNFDFTAIEFMFEQCDLELPKNSLWKNPNQKQQEEKSLNGLTFVVTGKLKSYKNRDELKGIIEAVGGKVTGSVSKNTSYLINNDVESTTAKNKTAKSLNIPIITEMEFKEKFDF